MNAGRTAGHGQRAAIIGAGLTGSLLASYLARRGWQVDVYERRDDPREVAGAGGRSINLGLSARGMAALREIGLLDPVLRRCVPMRGRYVHDPDGTLSFQPYGTRSGEVLHSILRQDLNELLIGYAEGHPQVRFSFRHALTELDAADGLLSFANGQQARADLVVGADGAHSTVRDLLQRQGHVRSTVDVLEWGYKELTIPAADDGSARTPLRGLHVWPGGGDGLMVAHPNVENSLTATMFLPMPTLARLDTETAVHAFLDDGFPDTAALMPDRAAEWLAHPVGKLVTVRAEPWRYGQSVVLVGDAAHAVYPFYGQGMNSCFEDCSLLAGCLDRFPADRGAALAEYQRLRKRHTDVLAELSERNFVELRDRIRSPWFRARKRADLVLHRMLGSAWLPLYTMISHRTIPYADALRRARRQDAALLTAVVLTLGSATGLLTLLIR
ncbi:NAD(P)/FAD-dependent oxidoreductase [Solwaraspora sp. WMMD406]|uniref:FAD-dependent oxidoreductase n=1 Tax=Solwaraspora sp. WMMD406 TaxID=3016095 RepID=UPI002415D672|nr:NAD(P)/FAD-dependent oxidoreductase [Solwaraspora sp. WMMD406]MDG4765163.1 NAD(P)/FAD-dependent oxidoreductase [Solwaraspora sp. WMMD406]